MGVLLIVGAVLYFRPISIWSTKHAIDAITLIDQMNSSNKIHVDFSSITRAKLCFLLKGIYASELNEFSNTSVAYPLNLKSISNGHYGFHEKSKTLIVYLRASKTTHDYAVDLKMYYIKCNRGGKCYSGPSGQAEIVFKEILKLCSEQQVKRIVITGSSLGASIGTILADMCMFENEITDDIQLVCFSAFGIGDKSYCQRVNESISSAFFIRNVNDPVSAGFNARIGIPILFDYPADTNQDAHCDIAKMIRTMSPDETIDNKIFYFSDDGSV